MKNKIFKSRFYNQVALKEGKIVKQSNAARINTELGWFSDALQMIPERIPAIYGSAPVSSKKGYTNMTMEYIDNDNLYNLLLQNGNKTFVISILESVADLMSKLHIPSTNTDRNDYRRMYLDKPLKAVKFFNEKYGDKIKLSESLRINGKNCTRPEILLKTKFYEIINESSISPFTFVHGDLTLSNIVADKHMNLYLIDPRGLFGNTVNFGDPNYDIAKFYFSIIGNFDSLNNHLFKVNTTNQNYQYDIYKIVKHPIEKIFWKYFTTDERLIRFIHSTIWLSLIPHLEESFDQTITAYLHGVYLLNSL